MKPFVSVARTQASGEFRAAASVDADLRKSAPRVNGPGLQRWGPVQLSESKCKTNLRLALLSLHSLRSSSLVSSGPQCVLVTLRRSRVEYSGAAEFFTARFIPNNTQGIAPPFARGLDLRRNPCPRKFAIPQRPGGPLAIVRPPDYAGCRGDHLQREP